MINCQLYDITDHLLLLITFGHGVCYRKGKQTENYLPSSSNGIRHIPFIFSKLEIEKQAHNLIPNLLLSCIHFYPNKLFSFRATIIIMMIKIIIFENFLWLSNISQSKHVMENEHRYLLLHGLIMPNLFIYLKYVTMEVTKLYYHKAAVSTGVVSHEETISIYCQLPR